MKNKKEVVTIGLLLFLLAAFFVLAVPQTDYTSPTPPNATTTSNTSIEINVSINEANLQNVKFNWNGTNYTLYNESLVLMLNFNNVSALGENDTYAVDLSNYSNNLTCSGTNCSVWNSSGKYGGAFEFDGADDYFTAADSPSLDINGSFSVSLWIKPDDLTGIQPIIAKGGTNDRNYLINLNGANATYGYEEEGGTTHFYTGTKTLTAGAWHYLTVTWNGSAVTGYVDASVDGAPLSSSAAPANGDLLYIGYHPQDAAYFNGTIDEVRIWNRSLSAEEIQQMYFSNLRKYNQTQWHLYVNQSKNSTSGLDDGTYTYRAFASDNLGNENSTELRQVTVDTSNIDVDSCRNLDAPGVTYTLQNNVSSAGTCFTILADNIVLDGQGYLINYSQSSTGYAINNTGGYDNITIKNLIIEQGNSSVLNSYAIYFQNNADNWTIFNNSVFTYGSSSGVYIDSGIYSNLTGNTIATSSRGVHIINLHNSTIANNAINSSESESMYLSGAGNSNITGNSFYSSYSSGSTDNAVYIIGGDSLLFMNNSLEMSHSGGGGYVYSLRLAQSALADSTSNNVSLNNISNTCDGDYCYGIYVDFASWSTLFESNSIERNSISVSGSLYSRGIYLYDSGVNVKLNNITGNNVTVSSSSGSGIHVQNADYNTIDRNKIDVSGSSSKGIYILGNSNSNSFEENTINATSGDAATLDFVASNNYPENNNFTNNTIIDNGQLQLNIIDPNINGTYLIDQPILNYSIAGTGGLVYFKDSNYGEIKFLEPINGSGSNLSNDVRIRNNSATVLSSSNPGLNRSANITLYGLSTSFSLPRILRDSSGTCNSTTIPSCYNFTSLNAGTVIFNVTSWTNYSIGEGDSSPPTVNLISPSNSTVSGSLTLFFSANFTDNSLKNATPYIWNSSLSLINNTETQTITGTSNSSNVSITLPADGTYYWNYYACDVADNCAFNSTNWSVSIDSTSPSNNPSSSSSGGSGGGGGGAGISISGIKKKSYTWTKIIPGKVSIMKNFDKDMGIKEIRIEVKSEARNAKMTVTTYPEKPINVSKEKTNKVYKYLQIETKNLEGKLAKGTLTIQVNKSWVSGNGLDKDSIAVFKFNESSEQWNELETVYKEEDNSYYYYDVELTSSSYLAISQKTIEELETAAETGESAWTTEDKEDIGAEKIPPGEKNKLFIRVLSIVIVLIIAGWLIISKKHGVLIQSKRLLKKIGNKVTSIKH